MAHDVEPGVGRGVLKPREQLRSARFPEAARPRLHGPERHHPERGEEAAEREPGERERAGHVHEQGGLVGLLSVEWLPVVPWGRSLAGLGQPGAGVELLVGVADVVGQGRRRRVLERRLEDRTDRVPDSGAVAEPLGVLSDEPRDRAGG